MKNFAGIILAAGKSSRMGKIKALLPYGKSTFIENIMDNYNRHEIKKIILVIGFNFIDIENHIKKLAGKYQKVSIIHNPLPENGQFSSLKYGIREIKEFSDFAVVTPVDCPGILPQTIQKIINHADTNKISIPSYGNKKGHPVVIPSKFFDDILNYPLEKSLRDFINEHQKLIKIIETQDNAILKNINSPEDIIDT